MKLHKGVLAAVGYLALWALGPMLPSLGQEVGMGLTVMPGAPGASRAQGQAAPGAAVGPLAAAQGPGPGSTPPGSGTGRDAAAKTAPPKLAVEFEKKTPLILSYREVGKYRAAVFIKNTGEADVDLGFRVELADAAGNVAGATIAITAGAGVLASGESRLVGVEISRPATDMVAEGYLILEAEEKPAQSPVSAATAVQPPTTGAPPRAASKWSPSTTKAASTQGKPRKIYVTRELILSARLPAQAAEYIVQGASAGAVIVFLFTLVWLRWLGLKSFGQMGKPGWTFGDSWGSNISVGAGLLTTLLSFTYLPAETYYMSKTSYQVLSAILAAVTVLAPAAYFLIRVPSAENNEHKGYVICFLVGSATMTWAGLGQLGTVGLLFAELERARLISPATLTMLWIPLGLVGVFLILYASRTVVQMAQVESASAGAAAARAAAPVRQAPAAAPPLTWP